MIVTLEDDDQRRRLVEDLRVLLNATNAAAVKDAQKQAGLLDGLSQHVGQNSQKIIVAASAVLGAPAILDLAPIARFVAAACGTVALMDPGAAV